MTKLWESDSFVDDNTLTVNITRIRRKLEGLGVENFIITKKGLVHGMIKYLKTRWKTGVLALLMVAVTAGILFLYDIPLEPVGYVAVFEMLLTGLGLCGITINTGKSRKVCFT